MIDVYSFNYKSGIYRRRIWWCRFVLKCILFTGIPTLCLSVSVTRGIGDHSPLAS